MRTIARLLAPFALASTAVLAQYDPAAIIAAQREAMVAFRAMDGVWRGPAWTLLASGEKRTLIQTERIGPFLEGTVKVIEGRGYLEDGKAHFNALGIISYDPARKAFSMRSYAQGRAGDFTITPEPGGYRWEIPTPGATIRYVATIRDGTLHEVGDRIVTGREPMRFFEMTLHRVGDTDWPLGTPVPPR